MRGKPPRRKVISSKQWGDSSAEFRYDWTCTLSCGHVARFGQSYKNVPAPKTMGCHKCDAIPDGTVKTV